MDPRTKRSFTFIRRVSRWISGIRCHKLCNLCVMLGPSIMETIPRPIGHCFKSNVQKANKTTDQWTESVAQSGVSDWEYRLHLPLRQSGDAGNQEAIICRFAIAWLWPDWVNQSGIAVNTFGEKAPTGNTDSPIAYAIYLLAKVSS